MNQIEIAPGVFVPSWACVSHGYHHCCGSFIIVLVTGGEIHIQDKIAVQATIDFWRSLSPAPIRPTVGQIPSDIEFWKSKPRLSRATR
jgi:hypothetical protein